MPGIKNEDRFRPTQLSCPMIRARLYRDIRNQHPRVSAEHWYTHTIGPSEVLMPELIALRVYGLDRLKWVVLVVAGLDDYRDKLESGETLTLPSLEWLRDRFTYYKKMEAMPVELPPKLAPPKPVIRRNAFRDNTVQISGGLAQQIYNVALVQP